MSTFQLLEDIFWIFLEMLQTCDKRETLEAQAMAQVNEPFGSGVRGKPSYQAPISAVGGFCVSFCWSLVKGCQTQSLLTSGCLQLSFPQFGYFDKTKPGGIDKIIGGQKKIWVLLQMGCGWDGSMFLIFWP